MSNVEIVREMYTAFLRRDFAVASAALDPERIVWDARRSTLPDMQGVHEGADATARVWGRWLEAWETITMPELEIVGAGDRVLVWTAGQVNRGRASGVEVAMDAYGWVYELSDGRVVRATFFTDRDEALAYCGAGA